MEKSTQTPPRKRGNVVVDDAAMSQYNDKVLFPEKLALAKKQLKNVKLPEEWKLRG